jgi:predicted metal-dependent HD superfamily phosphohydrolase
MKARHHRRDASEANAVIPERLFNGVPAVAPRRQRTDLASELWFDDLLGRLPVGKAEKICLSRTMRSTDRHYHGISHLADLWMRHQRHRRAAQLATPGLEVLIACAIAYHDCVRDSGRRDNAARSAQEWMRASEDSALSGGERTWVAQTILARRAHLACPASAASRSDDESDLYQRARTWFLDLTLTPLADAPESFHANALALRREAWRLSDVEWAQAREKALRRLIRAPRIYLSPFLAGHEARARRNILGALFACQCEPFSGAIPLQ